MKSTAIILVISFLVGCSTKQPNPIEKPDDLPIATPTPVPHYTGVGVVFKPVDKYTTKVEREIIARAGKKVNEIVKSQCFLDFMSKTKMIDTNGRKNAEVYTHLVSLSGEVPVEMYYRCMKRSLRCPVPTSAVAYRQPPGKTIYLNRAAFDESVSDRDWASTLAHEGLGHSLGEYSHSFRWTPERDFSVPYLLNAAIEKCYK